MSEAVKQMFGRIAGRYDLLNRVLSARCDVRWRRQALSMLDGRCERILDLACGTFDLGLDAIAHGHAGQIIAGDFCQPMLIAGQGKITGKPVAPMVADALHLPLADASVDAVIMAYGWRNLDDPAAGLREIHRVLRPGGQMMILEFFKPIRPWPKLFYNSFGRLVFPLLGATLAGNAEAYRYLRRSIEGFYSCDEATRVIGDNGFSDARWRSFFGGISHAVHARCCEIPPSC